MIDIFDIIADQKNVRIRIKGKVYEEGLFYDVEYMNEFINLIMANENDVQFKKFNIEEEDVPGRLTVNRFGIYGEGYQYRSYKTMEFDIDIYITNKLNKKIDSYLQDFIDLYTVGTVVCPNTITGHGTISSDPHEEYLSVGINHDADGDVSAIGSMPTDFSNMFRNCSNLDLSLLD